MHRSTIKELASYTRKRRKKNNTSARTDNKYPTTWYKTTTKLKFPKTLSDRNCTKHPFNLLQVSSFTS